MNKFFEFNLNVELGEVFNECTAYQISIEYLNKALDISKNLPINKYRLVEAYKLRGKSKMFLNDGQQKKEGQDWDFYWKTKKLTFPKAIIRVGSLFSGIGAFEQALKSFHSSGWRKSLSQS